MKNRMIIASVLAAATMAAAQADTVNYEFTYTGTSGSGLSATGTLVMSGTTAIAGSVTVSGSLYVDGTWSLITGSGLFISPSGAFQVDNFMDCNLDPALTSGGILFGDAGIEVNIWADGPGNYTMYGWTAANGYNPTDVGGTFECVKVPAPGAIALLGMAGVVGSRRRRS